MTARAPRIAIVLDHPQRDLAGIVLLAHELCQRGAVCHIVPLNLQEEEVWSLAPDFVLLNFVRRGNDRFATRMLDAGIPFGVLDTEGGVWDAPTSYSSMLWSDTELLHRVSQACMWGPRLAEHVVERGLFAPEQVAVTGCPRFDFYAPQWQPVIADGDREGAGYILINTNFSFANPRFTTVERNVRQLRDEIGWSHERTMQQGETERLGIAEIIRIARSLSADFPDRHIVLRPHPFEATETYRSVLADCPNVSIDAGGPVQPRIFRAAVVIQRGCSTAIESAMASVPTLSPRWFSIAGLPAMTEEVSDPCATYSEMRDKVAAILAGAYVPPPGLPNAIAQVIGDWFYAADGNAHRRAADAVMARVPTDRAVDMERCRRYLYGLRDEGPRFSTQRLSREVRRAVHLPPEWSFRRGRVVPQTAFPRSDKHFEAAQITAIAQRIADVLTRTGNAPRPVVAAGARARGDMLHGYQGFAVTLACA